MGYDIRGLHNKFTGSYEVGWGTDCHTQCAHWVRNDMGRWCGGFDDGDPSASLMPQDDGWFSGVRGRSVDGWLRWVFARVPHPPFGHPLPGRGYWGAVGVSKKDVIPVPLPSS